MSDHRVLVLHGPNLNLLGNREKEIYGHLTLDEINKLLQQEAKGWFCVGLFQSNNEGDLIDYIHAAPKNILNYY